MPTPLRRSSRSAAGAAENGAPARPQRRAARTSFYSQYFTDEPEEEEEEHGAAAAEPSSDGEHASNAQPVRLTRSGRRSVSYAEPEPEWIDEQDAAEPEPRSRRPMRRTRSISKSMRDFVAPDEEEEEDEYADYGETVRARRAERRENLRSLAASRAARRSTDTGGAAHMTRSRARLAHESDAEHTGPSSSGGGTSEESDGEPRGTRVYSFRTRKKINYSLVPPPPEPVRDGFGRRVRRGSSRRHTLDSVDAARASPEAAASGTGTGGVTPSLPSLPMSLAPRGALPSLPLDPADSSDEEAGGALGAGATAPGTAPGVLLGSGPVPELSSATDSFGRVKSSGDALADVDPLGVSMDTDFSQVGGLDQHVQQLKEMVSLPLLYPEVFQRFGMTPPRGVLFHGPPGTGKTLVARALAASCSTAEQPISFFMRKGADCLSKWVGEAERQLRLLFDEAKKSQPSIIFFDEIDGLAPVRSSKQDQIHASIVSTLLALMDGMDGRGQVVVIGATNRPDSVDPALRRPGRFDREFFFPLPSREARRSILDIHTRRWDPPLDPHLCDVLADATKGFGGADLRALCTEATLNAVQRRYPQIYHTQERLVLEPASIAVEARDFMLALDKIVPSSARSSSGSAAPLPDHLAPLLAASVQRASAALARLLPARAPRTALEEALWEVDLPAAAQAGVAVQSSAQALEQELLHQALDRARVYRPRFLLHGAPGLGQATVASAILHQLEGLHVQTLNVASLLGDSGTTPEAAVVQQFNEARRLKPSVLYVPGLDRWPALVSEAAREAFRALLDSLSGEDAVVLLAVSDVPFEVLPRDVRGWFGFLSQHRMELSPPEPDARRVYLGEIALQAARPPTQFADALPKRRRVLEELPRAPPRPPRQRTQLELRQEADQDARLLEHLKFRLGPVLAELRKKYKKFTRDVFDEYNLRELMEQFDWRREKGRFVITLRYDRSSLDNGEESEQEAEQEQGPEQVPGEEHGQQPGPEGQRSAVPADGTDATMHTEHARSVPGSVAVQETDPSVPDPAGWSASAETGPAEAPAGETLTGNAAVADEAMPASGQPSETPAQPNTDTTPSVAAAPPASDTTGMRVDPEDSRYVLRDLTIYTMNLEKMQKKLYYNGYLTSDQFMEDLNRIVDNAEAAKEVDADRVFRARQMRNLAVILVDQYLDAPFRAECAGMAKRTLARQAEAQAEAQRIAEQKATEARRPHGPRFSARQMGKDPEPAELVDVSTIERAHKRTRHGSNSAEPAHPDESIEENGEHAKRTRVEEAAPSAAAEDQVMSAPAPAADGRAASMHDNATQPASAPGPLLDEQAQSSLTDVLLRETDGFTVEQLEYLRAACIERVLAHRASWERAALVTEIETLAAEMRAALAADVAAGATP